MLIGFAYFMTIITFYTGKLFLVSSKYFCHNCHILYLEIIFYRHYIYLQQVVSFLIFKFYFLKRDLISITFVIMAILIIDALGHVYLLNELR